MNRRALTVLLMGALFLTLANAQSPRATPQTKPEKKPAAEKSPNPNEEKSGVNKLLGGGPQSNQPTTTEIYADEAFFDSNKSMGIFSGHVKVVDPRFNLQSDKLTVFISKAQAGQAGQTGQTSPTPSPGQTGQSGQSGQGLEKAIAEGNVAVVRDRTDPNGGPPTRAVGRADKAVYTANNGEVVLTGMPRVQQGLNMHIATSPDTVMVINQNGQLNTHGPSRTEIRQEPKDETAEGKANKEGKGSGAAEKSKSPSPTPEP